MVTPVTAPAVAGLLEVAALAALRKAALVLVPLLVDRYLKAVAGLGEFARVSQSLERYQLHTL